MTTPPLTAKLDEAVRGAVGGDSYDVRAAIIAFGEAAVAGIDCRCMMPTDPLGYRCNRCRTLTELEEMKK